MGHIEIHLWIRLWERVYLSLFLTILSIIKYSIFSKYFRPLHKLVIIQHVSLFQPLPFMNYLGLGPFFLEITKIMGIGLLKSKPSIHKFIKSMRFFLETKFLILLSAIQ